MRVLAALVWLLAAAPGAADAGGVVRAVLFVSPTCPHCRTVKEEALPAFAERFGPQVEIAIVSTGTPAGLTAFWAACQRHRVQRPGVPMLLAGDTILLGAGEIPALFPVLVETLLASGGSSWPDLPDLAAVLPDAETGAPAPAVSASPAPEVSTSPTSEASPTPARALVATPEPVVPPARQRTSSLRRGPEARVAGSPAPAPPSAAASPSATGVSPRSPTLPPSAVPRELSAIPDEGPPGIWARIALDPYGNSLSVVVLVAMLVVLARSAMLARAGANPRDVTPASWIVPALSALGLGIAAYLSWVETGHGDAVCGPVGDCNTVQQSEYARLFGLVPVGILGVVGFVAILAAWTACRFGPSSVRRLAAIVLLSLTGAGTLFSVYLTFLEPFVIGATCLWCLSSATIMTILYRLSFEPGRIALTRLLGGLREVPG